MAPSGTFLQEAHTLTAALRMMTHEGLEPSPVLSHQAHIIAHSLDSSLKSTILQILSGTTTTPPPPHTLQHCHRLCPSPDDTPSSDPGHTMSLDLDSNHTLLESSVGSPRKVLPFGDGACLWISSLLLFELYRGLHENQHCCMHTHPSNLETPFSSRDPDQPRDCCASAGPHFPCCSRLTPASLRWGFSKELSRMFCGLRSR